MLHGIANSIIATKLVNANEGHQLRQGCSSEARLSATKVTAPSNVFSEKRNPNKYGLQQIMRDMLWFGRSIGAKTR